MEVNTFVKKMEKGEFYLIVVKNSPVSVVNSFRDAMVKHIAEVYPNPADRPRALFVNREVDIQHMTVDERKALIEHLQKSIDQEKKEDQDVLDAVDEKEVKELPDKPPEGYSPDEQPAS